ncbi:hypothetical protein IFM89_032414 [Coptis chinensis]|uniref:Uncharacterized protein n=1 Tax=Coptis chinensis TaxID=261450 RepID=A0A835I6E5_9MAGN|nr:hypothetical protein IFM89_032414 [Coptis chinensis]
MSAAGFSKCSKIRHIVKLRQMLKRWRHKAAMASRTTGPIPSDVPAGHVALTVGTSCRRFIVRATYLNHPVFQTLLIQAEEEYGFTNSGPLAIPCDESLFEEILRYVSRSESSNSARFANLEDFQRYCHVGLRTNLDFWPESRPLLLHGLTENTIWTDRVGTAGRELWAMKAHCIHHVKSKPDHHGSFLGAATHAQKVLSKAGTCKSWWQLNLQLHMGGSKDTIGVMPEEDSHTLNSILRDEEASYIWQWRSSVENVKVISSSSKSYLLVSTPF